MKKPTSAKLIRMPKSGDTAVFSVESRILFLRQQRVIIDADLAELYGVSVKQLNQQIKRNRERFPADFLFELTPEEFARLKSAPEPHKLPAAEYTRMILAAKDGEISPGEAERRIRKYGGNLRIFPLPKPPKG